VDDEGGPQGYLLHISPTHAMFSGRAGTLSFHMTILCTLGIHQGHETSGHLSLESE